MHRLADIRQRTDYDCGLAAVRVLLRALRRRPSPDAMRHLGTTAIDGTDPRAIEVCLRAHSLMVCSGSLHWDMLGPLSKKTPVLALVTSGGIGHWVVVAGVENGFVYYQCPSNGHERLGRKAWIGRWRDVDRLGAIYHQWIIAAWKLPQQKSNP